MLLCTAQWARQPLLRCTNTVGPDYPGDVLWLADRSVSADVLRQCNRDK